MVSQVLPENMSYSPLKILQQFFFCIFFFLPKRLITNFSWVISLKFLLGITEEWTTFGEFHTTLTRSGQFTMPPICYLALTAKYMKNHIFSTI